MNIMKLSLILLTVAFSLVNGFIGYSSTFEKIDLPYVSGAPKDHAKVARDLVHRALWAGVGTISTDERLKGYPMVNIISISDSPKDSPSTGKIFFVLTNLDFTGQDISVDNKLTFMISKDQDLSCEKNNNTDPMEPICPRVILTGKVLVLQNGTEEYTEGSRAFVSRHPASNNWFKEHVFYLCKLNIENIYVLDWYGGPHFVTPEDYYKADVDNDNDIYENFQHGHSKNYKNRYHYKKELHMKLNGNKYKTINIKI